MHNIIKTPVSKVIDSLIYLRKRYFPKMFIKSEQYFLERKIEVMHDVSGYAEFSKILRSHIPAGASVLDVGCNRGLESAVIAQKNPVGGIDLYKRFVRHARKRGIDARVMDFHKMTFEAEFDCAYSNNTSEHSPEPDEFIAGVYRALKPGGVFVVGLPLDGNNVSVKDPEHFYRATEEDVVMRLEKAGFDILKKDVIDTKQRWNWENVPALNKVIICVAKKPTVHS